MEHNIDWYMGLVKELELDFQPRNALFDRIDEMCRPSWSLPADFTATVKNVMAIVDTAPSDAINSAAIAFSSVTPTFNVSPFMPNVAEYDRVQRIEDCISWHFKKANTRGNGTFMYDVADSSLRYNTVCVRVDDLAHITPKNAKARTPLQKRAWSMGRFINKVIHPRGVYYAESDLGVSTVAHVEAYRILDIIKYWQLYANNDTPEGQLISATLAKLKERIGYTQESADRLGQTYFVQAYCIDDDKLMIWGDIAGSASSAGNADSQMAAKAFIWADQPNPYGFIPWSIRVAGSRLESKMQYRVNPLLAPLYWSGSWDKLNLAKSIIFSEPIRRAQSPRMATFTQDGSAPPIDYENGSDINLRQGEDVKGLQPITLDQGAMAIVQQLMTEMNRTTGASIIGDTTQVSSRTTFATYSAMIKVALQRVDKQKELIARTVEDVVGKYLHWGNKTDVPLTSYAGSTKQYRSGTIMPMGQKIEVTKDDYDVDNLGIAVKIVSASPVDEMEQLNRAVILSSKMNVPFSTLLEEMGYENVELLRELWRREFLQNAEVNAQGAGMMASAQGQAQLETQMQMQQAQQQAQQAPAGPEQGISDTSFGALGGLGNGVNPAMQGMAPAQMAPTMTRENVTQRNYSQE